MKPIVKVSDSFSDWRLDGSAGLYAYVGLDLGSAVGELVGVKPLGLLEGFFGARQIFSGLMRLDKRSNQVMRQNTT